MSYEDLEEAGAKLRKNKPPRARENEVGGARIQHQRQQRQDQARTKVARTSEASEPARAPVVNDMNTSGLTYLRIG